MWDLWWTKRHWGRFYPSISVSLATHPTDCSTLIIIHHPGLVQWAKLWPAYQGDSVSHHPKKKWYYNHHRLHFLVAAVTASDRTPIRWQ
jgi:hypothetical protein